MYIFIYLDFYSMRFSKGTEKIIYLSIVKTWLEWLWWLYRLQTLGFIGVLSNHCLEA